MLIVVAAMVSGSVMVNSCVHQPYALPETQRTGDPGICFERDILPIFQSNCAKSGCHDASSHRRGLVLDNYNNIVKEGIVPGNLPASKIWEVIAIKEGGERMPKNGQPLSADALDKIKRWIIGGAIDTGGCNAVACDTNSFTYGGVIAPLMQTYCISCHSSSSAPGGSLTDYNSVKTAAVSGNMIPNISHTPGYNPMPQGSIKLSDCQVTQVKKWVAAGALND